MSSFLDKVRQKSDLEKKKIAFLGSFLITFIVFLIWFLSFVTTAEDRFSSEDTNKLKSNLASPIENIKEQFNAIFK